MAGAYDEAILGGKHIALARESEFVLGRTRVRPSTRTVEVDGEAEVVEPRMMQVLVALAGANGQVVTRDELIQLCWGGRVVGEDAISRVLWRLRQLLAKLERPGFEIETIPRVGYRLVVGEGHPALDEEQHPSSATAGVSRRMLATGAIAAAGVLAIGSLAWATGHRRHQPPEEAKRFFDRAMALRFQGDYVQSQLALAHLREAVRIDPQYSQAWGALALGYSKMLDWFSPRPDANQLKIAAGSAARRALDLDPDNPDAESALILLASPYGRWNEVERGLRDLLARHPDHHPSEEALASLMIETGRFTAAHDIYEKVTAREPFWAFAKWRVADCLLALGRLEEAEEQIEIGWRLWPRSFNFWYAKLLYLLVSGQEADALRFAKDEASRPLDFDAPVPREILVAQYLADRSAASLQRARDALIANARKDVAVAAMELPFIGEVDAAFEMYEGYFLDRGPWKAGPLERRYTGGLFEVTTAQLRKDARFIPLLRAIGLEHYYQVAGVEPDFMLA